MSWSDAEIINELEEVEKYIIKSVASRNKMLEEAVNSVVKSGGKRLRPTMVIVASKFGKYNAKKVIPVAAAVEILHTATLIHDDIIDKARIRRGNVTVSEKYGADMAVYTGDYLFTKSVLMLSGNVSLSRLNIVARGIKTICEGEVDQFQNKYNINSSVYSYLKRIGRKTAVLFGASCALGADIARCSPSIAKSLARFGFYYGTAFQIKDDIENFTSSKKGTDKPYGNDIMEGIITLPVIYALDRNQNIKKELIDFLNKRGKASKSELDEMIGLILNSGGIEDAAKLVDKYIEKGLDMLKGLPENKYKNFLAELIVGLRA